MKMKIITAVVVGVSALAMARDIAAMGLSTRFSEVSVQNVKIGQTYSMAELMNFPLRVMNTGSEPIPLSVGVIAPQPDEMKPGYEAIPATEWIRLQQSTFTVPPGMEAVTDVIISIPNDPSLLGRRFIVYLWTQSQNLSTSGVGLKSRLLLSVSSHKPTDEELKKKFVNKRLANLNFNLSPMEISLVDVPVGKKLALKERKSDVKLINPNEEQLNFKLTSVAAWEASASPPAGYEAAPDPKWLSIGREVLAAKPDSINALNLVVHIPADDRYKNRKYLFVLRAEILEQDIPAYAYIKIMIETQK